MKVTKNIGHESARREAYMPVGDQLDCLIKSLAYMASNGVDIGPDGETLVAHADAVKEKFKKTEG